MGLSNERTDTSLQTKNDFDRSDSIKRLLKHILIMWNLYQFITYAIRSH